MTYKNIEAKIARAVEVQQREKLSPRVWIREANAVENTKNDPELLDQAAKVLEAVIERPRR